MTPAQIDEMKDRIGRASNAARRASGDQYRTSFRAEGQDFVTNFTAIGVKAPEQLNDDFLALFIWMWSLKDYIKSAFEANGRRGQIVEDEINSCPVLTYVADIANRAKHGSLERSRSGKYAELVDVGFSLPQTAIPHIRVAGAEVTVEVAHPEQAEIHASVVTRGGIRLEAQAVLDEAMNFLETRLLSQISV